MLMGAAVALTVTAAEEKLVGGYKVYNAVKPNQVDNRTQRSDWAMTVYHQVQEVQDPVTEEIQKFLDVTTLIENAGGMFDEGLTYKEGHMYQAWISFKDPAKAVDVEVTFPTTVVAEDTGEPRDDELPRTFAVPSWDNVICTLRY